jgi:tetratricopeptide (TPR) repeat protein
VLACLAAAGGTANRPTPIMLHTTEVRATSTARVRRARIARSAVTATLAGAALAAVGLYLYFDRAGGASSSAAVANTHEPTAASASAPAAATVPAAPVETTPWPEPAPAPTPQPAATASKRVAARAAPVSTTATLVPPTARVPAARRVAEPDSEPAVKATAARAETQRTGAAPVIARGQAAFDRGDYPEAVRRGREAIAAGDALGGRLLIGDAYYRLERFADAVREYQAALALDPSNPAIRRRRDLADHAASPH